MVALLQMNPQLNGPTANVFEGEELEVGVPFNSQVSSQARIVGVATRTADNIYRGIGYDLISECSTGEDALIDSDSRLCPYNSLIVG